MAKLKDDFKYIRKVFRFMKPYALPYGIGLLFVGLQSFIFNFIIGILGSGMMAAIMERSINAVVTSAIVLVVMFIGYVAITEGFICFM